MAKWVTGAASRVLKCQKPGPGGSCGRRQALVQEPSGGGTWSTGASTGPGRQPSSAGTLGMGVNQAVVKGAGPNPGVDSSPTHGLPSPERTEDRQPLVSLISGELIDENGGRRCHLGPALPRGLCPSVPFAFRAWLPTLFSSGAGPTAPPPLLPPPSPLAHIPASAPAWPPLPGASCHSVWCPGWRGWAQAGSEVREGNPPTSASGM